MSISWLVIAGGCPGPGSCNDIRGAPWQELCGIVLALVLIVALFAFLRKD